MQTAAAVVATSYGSRRALPRTRSDGLLCLSGSYSRLLQGQKLPPACVFSASASRVRGLKQTGCARTLPAAWLLRAHSGRSAGAVASSEADTGSNRPDGE